MKLVDIKKKGGDKKKKYPTWKQVQQGKVASISKGDLVRKDGELMKYNGRGGLDPLPSTLKGKAKPDKSRKKKRKIQTNYKSTGSKKGKATPKRKKKYGA